MQPRQLATFAAGTLSGVALIVACGALPVVGADDSDDPSVYRSGTRIKARVYETEDGARQFAGWFDTKFGVRCQMTGSYCLPKLSTEQLFLDPDCTEFGMEGDGLLQRGRGETSILHLPGEPLGSGPLYAKHDGVECGLRSEYAERFRVGEPVTWDQIAPAVIRVLD